MLTGKRIGHPGSHWPALNVICFRCIERISTPEWYRERNERGKREKESGTPSNGYQTRVPPSRFSDSNFPLLAFRSTIVWEIPGPRVRQSSPRARLPPLLSLQPFAIRLEFHDLATKRKSFCLTRLMGPRASLSSNFQSYFLFLFSLSIWSSLDNICTFKPISENRGTMPEEQSILLISREI